MIEVLKNWELYKPEGRGKKTPNNCMRLNKTHCVLPAQFIEKHNLQNVNSVYVYFDKNDYRLGFKFSTEESVDSKNNLKVYDKGDGRSAKLFYMKGVYKHYGLVDVKGTYMPEWKDGLMIIDIEKKEGLAETSRKEHKSI